MSDTDNLGEYPPDPPEGVPVPRAAGIRRRMQGMHPQQGQSLKKVRGGHRKLLAQENRRKALELRKGGATYDQIAQAVGYKDASGARKAVKSAIEAITQEPAIEVKSLQIERLNHMLLTLWPKIQQGDERAIDTGLRVMDKLDRLMGTESAAQVDINVNHTDAILIIDGNKDDYIAQMKRMTGVPGIADTVQIEAQAHQSHPQGVDSPVDIIDAEVVGDIQDDTPEPVQGVTTQQEETGRKKYAFGMDPKIGRQEK